MNLNLFLGYGINIVGGREQCSPIYISKILPNSIAQQSQLRRGDQLIELNGINIENETHEKVVDLLKNADEVELVVRWMPDYLEKLEFKYGKPQQIRKNSHKSSR